jgi:hypothetical protein
MSYTICRVRPGWSSGHGRPGAAVGYIYRARHRPSAYGSRFMRTAGGLGQWLVPHAAVRNLIIAQRAESLTAIWSSGSTR